ncbi:UNVERIFIED_ORG: transposase [Xanthomonas axonopodis]
MLTVEEQVEIKILARQGMSIREISRQLQVSRNTVRRYLRDVAAAQRQPRGVRPHKLDPYRTYIEQRVRAAHPAWLPATVIKQEIALLGYRGGMSRLRQFMRSLRVVRPQEPLVRFETPPRTAVAVRLDCFPTRQTSTVGVCGYARLVTGQLRGVCHR